MDDKDREQLLAKQQAVADAEAAVEVALVDRNTYMRSLAERGPRGIVAEMARVLEMNRVTVSNLVNPGAIGSGRRQPNRNTGTE